MAKSLVVMGLLAAPSFAATITFGASTAIGTDATSLNQPGDVIRAVGAGIQTNTTTDGGILFQTVGNSGDALTGNVEAPGSPSHQIVNSDTGFATVLDGLRYSSTGQTLTLNNLVIGTRYAIQLFAVDNRAAVANRTQEYTAGTTSGVVSPTAGGQYVIGTFVADAASQVITITQLASVGITPASVLNAFVLRQVVPELNAANFVAPFAAVALLMVGLMDRRRKASGVIA